MTLLLAGIIGDIAARHRPTAMTVPIILRHAAGVMALESVVLAFECKLVSVMHDTGGKLS